MSALGVGVGSEIDQLALLARANPVAKLAVATTIAFGLLLSVDPVTAGVVLAGEFLAVPWLGVPVRTIWRRAWFLLVAAVPSGVMTALLGADSGRPVLDLGIVDVSTGSIMDGLGITLRILAIGLPGVLLLLSTDPTDLADALAQVLRLPSRFVLAALAATQLLGALAAEWDQLTMARRARGIGDDGLLGRMRTTVGQVFSLLVLALRRGAVLSISMEARGFGVQRRRTWARTSTMRRGDWWVVAGGIVLVAVATAIGISAGTWNLLLA